MHIHTHVHQSHDKKAVYPAHGYVVEREHEGLLALTLPDQCQLRLKLHRCFLVNLGPKDLKGFKRGLRTMLGHWHWVAKGCALAGRWWIMARELVDEF